MSSHRLAPLALLALLACQAPAAVGTPCARASDCPGPLVCVYGACRAQCRETRDCPLATRCIAASGGAGVCTLDVENHCDRMVCPTPLVCAGETCRTTCSAGTECLAGMCSGGTCDEPTSGSDAGAPSADAGLDAPTTDVGADAGGCALTVAQDQTWASGQFFRDDIAIATSETGTGSSTTAQVHVAAFGVLDGTSTESGFVLVGAPGATSARATIDLHDAFGLVSPSSVGLGRRDDGDVSVLALFDHSDDATAPAAVGAYGTIAAGAASVSRAGWICAEPTCMDGSTLFATSGRALVLGHRVAGHPMFVYRTQTAGGAFDLAALDEATMMPVHVSGHVPQPMLLGDLAAGNDSVVALYDPGDGATTPPTLAVWDTNALSTPPQLITGSGGAAGMATPQGRPALAALGSNRFALVYDSPAGDLVGYFVSCVGGPCDVVPASATPLFTNTDGSGLSPAVTELPGGFALAYSVRTTAGDVVWLATYRTPSGAAATQTALVRVFSADPGREIGDLQVASAHVGTALHLVVAIHERGHLPPFPPRIDTIRVVDVTTATCP